MKFIKVALLIVLFSALAACGGAEARKEKYLKAGKQYLQQNNLEKARLEFRNVLQIDPKSSQGYFYMGQVNEKSKDYRKALGNYNKAVELNKEYVDAIVGSARIYLVAGMPDKTLELSKKALDISPSNIDVLAVRAGALYQTGKKDQALTDIENNLRVNLDHLASLSLLSRIYMATNQASKVEALLLDALSRNPDDINIIVLLVQVYSDNKQYADAATQMEKLIKFKPESLNYRLRMAYFLDLTGGKEQALLVLKKAAEDLDEDMQAKVNLIQYTAEKFNVERAQKTLKIFIEKDADNPQLKLLSASLYIKSKEIEKSEKIYRKIIREYEGDAVAVNAQYELVRLLINEQRSGEAEDVLAELLKNEPRHSKGLTLRGAFALERGDATGAIADFRTIQKDQPTSTKYMGLLADAYLLDGQTNLAAEQLKTLLLIEPKNIVARMALAKLYHQDKDFKSGLEQLDVVLQLQPDNLSALSLKFKAYLALGDLESAIQLAENLQHQQPESALGFFYQGLALQAQNKLQKSLLSYDKALQLTPDAAEPLGAYVGAALALKKPELAEKKLTLVLKQQKKHYIAQNLLGEVLLQQKKYQTAAQAFSAAIKMNSQWWLPYRNLASVQIHLKQTEQAIATYRKGLADAEKADRLLVLLASLLTQHNKVDEAIAVYEAFLDANPKSSVAANNLAVMLVEYRDDDASKKRALSLVETFKNTHNAGYLDTLGWVYYKHGEYDKAVSALLKADANSPRQVLIYYHLGKTYLAKGDKLSAHKYFQKVADSSINFKGKHDAERILLSLDKA